MIALTGATGHLGRLVVTELLKQDTPPSEIVAITRNAEKAKDLAAEGVVVREADYARPDTYAAALVGVDKVLLISSNAFGAERIAQHQNVVDAARTAGVALLAYTSILKADMTHLSLADDHKATEQYIRASGLPFVFLRNGWYTENYTGTIVQTMQQKAIMGAAKDGRVSLATRADYAAAAAAVLTGDGHANSIYELGGDDAFTLTALAAAISRLSGVEVVYHNLPVEEFKASLLGFGLPEHLAAMLADADDGLAHGDLFTDSGDLHRLIQRPTTSLDAAITVALHAVA